MQLELFSDDNYNGDIALEDLFEAYLSCRKNKRKTADALSFEVDYESKLIQLWREINDGTYTPGRSVAFIVNKPVKREIFAAAFRDRNRIIEICRAVIYNDPTKGCVIKGARADWDELPKRKSLFHSTQNCGLPIGNLTSQVFANFYLNPFDHFIKHTHGIRYYNRYVDDFVLVHRDKQVLIELVPQIEAFLRFELGLLLHPRKRYLQHYAKGVAYLGSDIKPGRIYIGNRTKGNLYDSLIRHNEIVRCRPPDMEELQKFMSSVNSYLGIMKHYATFSLRRKMLLSAVSDWWWKYVYVSGGYRKVSKNHTSTHYHRMNYYSDLLVCFFLRR